MLAGKTAAQAVNICVADFVELCELFFPFFVGHIHLQAVEMQVTVTCVSQAHAFEIKLLGNLHQVVQADSDFVDRYNKVIRGRYLAQSLGAFQTAAAYLPYALVCFNNVGCTAGSTDFVKLLHLHIQLVLVKGFHGNDNVAAILVMRQTLFCIIAGSTYKAVVHKFNTCRIQAGLNQRRHQVDSLLYLGENCKDIQTIRSQRQQLQSCFGDDTQSTLTAHYQLVEAVAGAAFFQAVAQLSDFTGRSNNLDRINLMTGSAVAYSLIAAGVGCNVAADHAAVCAAWVTGIQQACFVSLSLNIGGQRTSLNLHIHSIGIKLNNLVHAFHQQHNAAENRNRTAGYTGTGTARSYRHKIFIGDFHNSSHLFGAARCYNHLRQMMVMSIRLFVGFVTLQSFGIIFYMLCTDCFTQLLQDFFGYGIVICHTKISPLLLSYNATYFSFTADH